MFQVLILGLALAASEAAPQQFFQVLPRQSVVNSPFGAGLGSGLGQGIGQGVGQGISQGISSLLQRPQQTNQGQGIASLFQQRPQQASDGDSSTSTTQIGLGDIIQGTTSGSTSGTQSQGILGGIFRPQNGTGGLFNRPPGSTPGLGIFQRPQASGDDSSSTSGSSGLGGLFRPPATSGDAPSRPLAGLFRPPSGGGIFGQRPAGSGDSGSSQGILGGLFNRPTGAATPLAAPAPNAESTSTISVGSSLLAPLRRPFQGVSVSLIDRNELIDRMVQRLEAFRLAPGSAPLQVTQVNNEASVSSTSSTAGTESAVTDSNSPLVAIANFIERVTTRQSGYLEPDNTETVPAAAAATNVPVFDETKAELSAVDQTVTSEAVGVTADKPEERIVEVVPYDGGAILKRADGGLIFAPKFEGEVDNISKTDGFYLGQVAPQRPSLRQSFSSIFQGEQGPVLTPMISGAPGYQNIIPEQPNQVFVYHV